MYTHTCMVHVMYMYVMYICVTDLLLLVFSFKYMCITVYFWLYCVLYTCFRETPEFTLLGVMDQNESHPLSPQRKQQVRIFLISA